VSGEFDGVDVESVDLLGGEGQVYWHDAQIPLNSTT
jgi:hypothetical protein